MLLVRSISSDAEPGVILSGC